MPSINDVFGGEFLKASDITGREPTVTIKSVVPQEFTDKQTGKVQKKLIISFNGAKKSFVSNVTNAKRIAYMHGDDYSHWIGKQITLFVDPFVQFGNEIKPAIRVKPPSVAHAPAPAPQSHDELEPEPEPTEHDEFGDNIPF